MAILFLAACGNDGQQAKKTADENASFYPFPQYLADQFAYIDSMPLAVEKVVKVNGITTDSGYMAKDTFKIELSPFLSQDPNSKALKKQYTETSFQDLSLKAITFSINSKNADLPLQQADILLNDETRQVKNVVIKMTAAAGDSTVEKRLLWQHNMKCLISEIVVHTNGKSYTRSINYQWDVPMHR